MPEDNNAVHGTLQQKFGSDENLQRDDVFHACADGGGNDDVTFKTLREMAQEQPWPTGCDATRSCIVESYIEDEAHADYPGFVGHLLLTLTPRTMTWKAEAWIEHKNLKGDGWASFCSPYDVVVPDGVLVLAVTDIAKTATATDDARINIKSMVDVPTIPAENGVLVKGTGTFRFHPATSSAADMDSYENSGNQMQYVPLNQINSLPYNDGDYVFTYNETEKAPYFVPATPTDEGGDWSETSDAGRIPPFKAYLHLTDPSVLEAAGTRGIIVNVDGAVSGVSSAVMQPAGAGSAVVCDLSGRRCAAATGLRPGLYIVDGKKCYINK